MSPHSQFMSHPYPPYVGRNSQRVYNFFPEPPHLAAQSNHYYGGNYDASGYPPQHYYHPPAQHPSPSGPHFRHPPVHPAQYHPPYSAPPPQYPVMSPATHPQSIGQRFVRSSSGGGSVHPVYSTRPQPQHMHSAVAFHASISTADIDPYRLGYTLPVSGRPNKSQRPRLPPTIPYLSRSATSNTSQPFGAQRQATPSVPRGATQRLRPLAKPVPHTPTPPSRSVPSLLLSRSSTPSPHPVSSSTARPASRVQTNPASITPEKEAASHAATSEFPILPQKAAGPVPSSDGQVANAKPVKTYAAAVAQPKRKQVLATGANPVQSSAPQVSLAGAGLQIISASPVDMSPLEKGGSPSSTRQSDTPTPAVTATSAKSTQRGTPPAREPLVTPTQASLRVPPGLEGCKGRFIPPASPALEQDLSPTSRQCSADREPSFYEKDKIWSSNNGGLTPPKKRFPVAVPDLIHTSPTPRKTAKWEPPVDDRSLLTVPPLNLSTGRLPEELELSIYAGHGADVFEADYDCADESTIYGNDQRQRTADWVPDSPLSEHADELHLFSSPPSPSPATTQSSLPGAEEEEKEKEHQENQKGDSDDGEVRIVFNERKDGFLDPLPGVSLLECSICKGLLKEMNGNPLKEKLNLREIDIIFRWNQLPLTRKTIPVSLLGLKIERLEIALIVARVCVSYFMQYANHPSAPDIKRLRLLGVFTVDKSALVPMLSEF